MRCPPLSELPPPLPGKTGWPWTEETQPSPAFASGERDWPRISIVTPSYNQAQFLEETIRSVLLQGYPNLEYFVMDGGSQDESVEIIEKYKKWITHWVSEPDQGQAAAINQGFELSTGDWLVWINSDDLLLPSALTLVGRAQVVNQATVLLGDVLSFSPADELVVVINQNNVTARNMLAYWRTGWSWAQPGTLISRLAWEQIGLLDVSLRYVFDREWMCRALIAQIPLYYLHESIAAFRLHSGSKTVGEANRWGEEQAKVTERYAGAEPHFQVKELRAMQELANAVFFTSVYFLQSWNGNVARLHLWKAFSIQPEVLLQSKFWSLTIRSLVPLVFVRLVRHIWIGYRRKRQMPVNSFRI